MRALGGALGLAALAALAFLGASLPRTRGTATLPGLGAPVRVVRDGAGVPHIVARTDADALRALGYVHAQDRLWQMEWQRRIGAGRLAEVVGEDALEIDRFLRTLGTYRAAEAEAAALSGETRALLDAYVAGVNALLASARPLPPEFALLGVRPEPWRAADSLVWIKMMAWNLGGNWDLELLRAWLEHRVGSARAAELLPEYPAGGPTILGSAGAEPPARAGARPPRQGRVVGPDIAPGAAAGLLALGSRLRGELRLGGPGVGSNAWVIAGRHTASGRPLLANDPHLGTQIPSQWYLAALRGDRLDVAGGTLPGLPGVVVGRNARIAWGFTNLGADVQDLYVERLHPEDPGRVWDGGWRPLDVVSETIRVRGRAEPVAWAARASRHGPLIGDALDALPPAVDAEGHATALALRWTALDPGDRTLEAFLAMDRAADWPSFLAATRGFAAPNQNVVYADAAGHIGYVATGRVPIRGAGDGRLPAPGWDPAYDWRGYAPPEDLPRSLDPPAGWIVTANQRVTADPGAPFLTDDWALPFRAARLERALVTAVAGGRGVTPEDAARMQLDTGSDAALRLRDALAKLPAATPRQAEAIARVAAWDGDNRVGDVAPTIVQAWLVALVRALVADELDDDRLADYLTLDDLNHRNAAFALWALEDGAAAWCDDRTTPAAEACAETALRALDEALDDLGERLGPRMGAWRWGRVHRTQLPHAPLSAVAALRPIFHRAIEAGGDAFSPNVGAPSWDEPFDHEHAPGYRHVLDLGTATGRFGLITGQSGHPLSRHYADRVRPHRDGAYLGIALDPPAGGRELWLVPEDARP